MSFQFYPSFLRLLLVVFFICGTSAVRAQCPDNNDLIEVVPYCPDQWAEYIPLDAEDAEIQYQWFAHPTDSFTFGYLDHMISAAPIPAGSGDVGVWYSKEISDHFGPQLPATWNNPPGEKNGFISTLDLRENIRINTIKVPVKIYYAGDKHFGLQIRVGGQWSPHFEFTADHLTNFGDQNYVVEVPINLEIEAGNGIEFQVVTNNGGNSNISQVDGLNWSSGGLDTYSNATIDWYTSSQNVSGQMVRPLTYEWDYTVICPRTYVTAGEESNPSNCCTRVSESPIIEASQTVLISPFSQTISTDGNPTHYYQWLLNGAPMGVEGLGLTEIEITSTGQYEVRQVIDSADIGKFSCYQQSLPVRIDERQLFAPEDVEICEGTSIELLVRGAQGPVSWTPSTGFNDATVVNPIVAPQFTTTYAVTAPVAVGNAIINGDFEQGNVGFNTIHNYVSNPEDINSGKYTIGTFVEKSWWYNEDCKDHNTGTGNFMYLDVMPNNLVSQTPVPDRYIWQQTVNVNPGQQYTFSAWATNISFPSDAQPTLQLYIDGQAMIPGGFTTEGETCLWQQLTAEWNAGDKTTASLAIVELTGATFGNDMALDDITFGAPGVQTDSVTVTVVTCQPERFPCNNNMYLLSGMPSTVNNIEYDNGVISWEPTGIMLNTTINGAGYNMVDGMIYGIDANNQHLIQIQGDGTVMDLGVIPGMSTGSGQVYSSGDIDRDGNYYLILENQTKDIVRIDLKTKPLNAQIVANHTGATVYDIAIHPITKKVYGFNKDGGANGKRLVEIDLTTGQSTPIGNAQNHVNILGSLWFDAFGNLFGYGQASSDGSQVSFFKADIATGEFELLAKGPVSSRSDGIGCPYTVDMTKSVNKATAAANSLVTYTIEIANSTPSPLFDVSFVDVLPDGFQVYSAPDELLNGVLAEGAQGDQRIGITGMTIPVGYSSLNFEVYLPCVLQNTTVWNQAFLLDLPGQLHIDTLYSDFPVTAEWDDPTPLIITPVASSADPDFNLIADQTEICPEQMVNLVVSDTADLGRFPTISWVIDNTTFTQTSLELAIDTLTVDHWFKATFSYQKQCGDTLQLTDSVLVKVTPLLQPHIGLTQDINNVCEGTAITFHITDTLNGGPSLVIEWFRNDTLLAHLGSFLVLDDLKNEDQISVKMTSSAGCVDTQYPVSDSVIVSITSIPVPPIVESPQIYVLGEITQALDQHVSAAGDILWYAEAFGGTGQLTAFTPSSSEVGNTIYYLSQIDGECESPRIPIEVIVLDRTLPGVIGYDQLICLGSDPDLIEEIQASTGTSTGQMHYKWYNSEDAQTWTEIPNATEAAYQPPSDDTPNWYRRLETDSLYGVYLVNTGFEPPNNPSMNPNTFSFFDSEQVLGWQTTATDNKIEIWHNFQGVVAAEGGYFVELNAYMASRLYQTVYLINGQILGWNFDHRGRTNGVPDVLELNLYSYDGQVKLLTLDTAVTDRGAWKAYAGSTVIDLPDGLYQFSFEAISTGSGDVRVGNFLDDIHIVSSFYSNAVKVEYKHTSPPTVMDTVYCQFAPTIPLQVEGENLLWYDDVSGGTGDPVAPIPTTQLVDTMVYYVSQTVDGCESERVPLSLGVKPLPGAAITGDAAICAGETANLEASGGAEYLWNTGETITQITVEELQASTRFFITTTLDGCIDTSSFLVRIMPGPDLKIAPVEPMCQGDSVQLTASGADQYLWVQHPSLSGIDRSDPTVQPSRTTTYEVLGSTAFGCTVVDDITVVIKLVPSPPATMDALYCRFDPALPLQVEGENLLWYNDATDGTGIPVAPLPSTQLVDTLVYYVSQTMDGCESSRAPVSVTVKPLPDALIAGTEAICPGKTVSLEASGGMEYIWNTGETSAHITTEELRASTRFFVTTTLDRCIDTSSFLVRIMPIPDLKIGPVDPICQGDSIRLIASGADEYLWVAHPSLVGKNRNDPMVYPAQTTSYEVLGSTQHGCAALKSVTIEVIPYAVAVVPDQIKICETSGDTVIRVQDTPGKWLGSAISDHGVIRPRNLSSSDVAVFVPDGKCAIPDTMLLIKRQALPSEIISSVQMLCAYDDPIQLEATPGGGTWSGPVGEDGVFTPSTASTGVHKLTYTPDIYCALSSEYSITVKAIPNAGLPARSFCAGDGVVALSQNPNKGIWSSMEGLSPEGIINVDGLEDGLYHAVHVVDEQGCSDTAIVQVYISSIAIDLGPDTNICVRGGGPITLTVEPQEATLFQWSTGDTDAETVISAPGEYSLKVTNEAGCFDNDTIEVFDACPCRMYLPNAFTPDGDGLNDRLQAVGSSRISFRMTIFDRWGEVVFETSDQHDSWDGTYRGSPAKQDVYTVTLECPDGGDYVGRVTLLR